VVPRYENPQIIIELHFEIKQIKTPKNKFEREPTEKKFQKIKHQSLKRNKILAKAKKVFKWKVFLKNKNFKMASPQKPQSF
jgi:hypothetical protein